MSKIVIYSDRCKGCGLCVSVCPKKILALSKEILNQKGYHPSVITDIKTCITCGMCATICPDNAIQVKKKSNQKTTISQPERKESTDEYKIIDEGK